MGREKVVKKIAKSLICTMLIVLFFVPSYALSEENNSSNLKTESIKTTPLKSFFARFVKKKTNKNSEKKANDKKSSETNVAILNGNVTFTMEDCVKFALENDPDVKNLKATQKAQKNAVGIAKSNYFPRITGSTGYNVNNIHYSDVGNVNSNNYGVNVGVNQLIWDFGYTQANINMSKYNYQAAGYDLDFQVAVTTYNIRLAYTAVLAARANEDIYERSVRINELNVDRTKAMYEVGLKSKIDLVNAQATLTQARIDLLTAQNNYQVALINLNRYMYYIDAPNYSIKETETFNFQKNYSVKNEIDVAYNRKNYNPNDLENEIKDGAILTSQIEKVDIIKSYKFKPFNMTMQEAIKTAYANRPDLKSFELVEKAQEENLKVIKRSYYPALNASAGYGFGSYSDYNASNLNAFAGLSLPSTGVNAMKIKNQIEQGKAYLDIAKNNVEKSQKGIYFDVQNYYINMKQLEKTIPLMSQKVEQSLENFELADGRYAVGLGNYLELQQAQTDYNNAQLAFVQSVFNYNEALFYLKKAMGIL